MFLLEPVEPVAFEVSFEDGIVVSEAHFPIVDYEVVDDVDLVLVWMHIE